MSKRSVRLTLAVGKARHVVSAVASAIGLLVLSSCGGGGGSSVAPVTPPSATCSVDAQKDWLRSYMLDQYLWSGASPNPEPAGFSTLLNYFAALLYPGDGLVPSVVPADKWSYISDAASYTQFLVLHQFHCDVFLSADNPMIQNFQPEHERHCVV